ncbi:MAG TPA: hypothetical protein VNW52_08350 [Burkholderiaceae bacterium]|jgi:hypothetical protein|nr:hypothetical protein [Burkholderiaceae bacterium]
MLRSTLLGIACVLALVGVFRLFAGDAGAWPMAIWGVVLVLAVVLERWRYQQRDDVDGGEWQATEERFVDPETGREVQVFYQPTTGKRRYMPVGNAE